MIDFVRDESGLSVGNNVMCICEACDLSIRQALKARDKGESYQLRWMKGKVVSVLCAILITRLKSIFYLGGDM